MPTYLYRCECGLEMIETHSIDAEPQVSCPDCEKKMNRVPQFTTVKFIGTGWGHQ